MRWRTNPRSSTEVLRNEGTAPVNASLRKAVRLVPTEVAQYVELWSSAESNEALSRCAFNGHDHFQEATPKVFLEGQYELYILDLDDYPSSCHTE